MPNDFPRRCRHLIAAALIASSTGPTAMAADRTPAPQSSVPLSSVPLTPVTLINVFEVPDGQLDRTIAFWEQARDFLKDQPGFLDTRLHQALSPDARFQLVNVARWQTPQAYRAAIGKLQASDLAASMRGTVFHAALYQVIRDVGESN